jgi:hypothetical protein
MSLGVSNTQKKRREKDIANIHRALSGFDISYPFPRISDMLEEVMKIKSDVETLYLKRRVLIEQRDDYLGRIHNEQIPNDILFNGDMMLDFSRYTVRCLSNVMLSSLISNITIPDIDYRLSTISTHHNFDIRNAANDEVLLKMTIETWIENSGIISSTPLSAYRIIRRGLLVHIFGFYDNESGTTVGHEFILMLDKTSDGQYYFYILDNLDTKEYKMEPGMINIHKWISASVHSYFYKKGRLNIFVKTIKVDTLPVVSRDLDEKEAAGEYVVSGISYTCMSVARRVALYAGIVQNIYDKASYDEYENEKMFYQNYVNYSYNIYRMLEWILRYAPIWQDIPIDEAYGSLGKRRMPIVYDGLWPLVLPAIPFCVNQFRIYELAFDSSGIRRLIVDLIPENAYIQIQYPEAFVGTDLSETKRSRVRSCNNIAYFFHGDGEVFRRTSHSTCSVSSKFHF